MSVIPLILEGPNRTIVGDQQEFQGAGGPDGEVIWIGNLDSEQLRSPESANVSYDLRVGGVYRDHRDAGPRELAENGTIKLLPGVAVIIETKEFVHFPKSAFGHIVPKVSLLQKGISNTSSKVDPGYHGNLLITVFNLGERTIELKRDERFCSLYILRVLEGARPYGKSPKRITGRVQERFWNRLKDHLEANSALVSVGLMIATFTMTIISIISIIIALHSR